MYDALFEFSPLDIKCDDKFYRPALLNSEFEYKQIHRLNAQYADKIYEFNLNLPGQFEVVKIITNLK